MRPFDDSPGLLGELGGMDGRLERRIDAASGEDSDAAKLQLDEQNFRWMLNEDAMATEKLAEGIRKFAGDLQKLAEHLRGLRRS
jgi:transaldolase